jgi:hypothetical protein
MSDRSIFRGAELLDEVIRVAVLVDVAQAGETALGLGGQDLAHGGVDEGVGDVGLGQNGEADGRGGGRVAVERRALGGRAHAATCALSFFRPSCSERRAASSLHSRAVAISAWERSAP